MHELSRTSEDIIRNKTYNENDVGVEKLLRDVFLICSPLVLPQRRPSTFTLSGVWRGVVHPGASVGHTHVIKSGVGVCVCGEEGGVGAFSTPLTFLLAHPGRLEKLSGGR